MASRSDDETPGSNKQLLSNRDKPTCQAPLASDETSSYEMHLLDDRRRTPVNDIENNGQENGPDTAVSQSPERATWRSRMWGFWNSGYILICLNFSVGLGNVWRFPYLCYKNGGGAFLIPYVIMLVFVGFPICFMTLVLGQFAGSGMVPISFWNEKINPLMKGLGYGMVIISWLISLYYIVVISHALFYLFASLNSVLPWTTCDNDWNTEACLLPSQRNTTVIASIVNAETNATVAPNTVVRNLTAIKTPSEEYYYNYVLEKSSGIHEIGLPAWKLLLCLLIAWNIVLAGLLILKSFPKIKNLRISAYFFTFILPISLMMVLLIHGVTLSGAKKGIIYYLKPDFSRLADARVWTDAATQILYSLSACSGELLVMASNNKIKRLNCLRVSLVVCILDSVTSIIAGLVIFSVLGFMATEKGVDMADVAVGGPGLVFAVYPEAIARLPVAPLWAIFFFLMIAALGVGSQFSLIKCVISAFKNEFKLNKPVVKSSQKESFLICGVIGVSCLLGIPMTCKGGIYLLNLIDYSIVGFPLLFVALFELVSINWIYGFNKFKKDANIDLNTYWKICWKWISPALIMATILFNVIHYKPPNLDGYFYPIWAQKIGWLITTWPILMIPGWIMYRSCRDRIKIERCE